MSPLWWVALCAVWLVVAYWLGRIDGYWLRANEERRRTYTKEQP